MPVCAKMNRRAILSAAPLLVAAPLFAAPAFTRAAATPDFAAIERAAGGKLGVFAIDTATGATAGWRADSRFPFCSSFKAPLAAFVLWTVDRGDLRLDRPVRFAPVSPFPLEGGRAGMGVCAGAMWKPIGGAAASSATLVTHSARTPAQPSPFEGEGSGTSHG